MPGMELFGSRVASNLAVLTMTVGNLLALWQDNIRRLLAYSSIAHGGYMLIGLALRLRRDQFRRADLGRRHRGPALLPGGLRAGDDRHVAAPFIWVSLIGKSTASTNWRAWGPHASLGRANAGRVHVQPGGHSAASRLLGVADVCSPALWALTAATWGQAHCAPVHFAGGYRRVERRRGRGLLPARHRAGLLPLARFATQRLRAGGACAANAYSYAASSFPGLLSGATLVDGSNAASQSARIDAARPAAKGVAANGVAEKMLLSVE